MRRLRKLGYAVLAAVPVVALAACSSGGGSGVASGPPPEQSTIVVDAVPTADEAGLYIAQDNGYFKQQGLTVKINTVFGGELGLPDLQNDKAQILAGNYVSFILAQIAGKFGLSPATTKPISLKIIADGSQMQPGNQAIYVMPDSKIKKLSDLVKYHATVAFNTAHNVGQVFFNSLFQANGLDFGKIHQVYYPFPQTLGLLPTHQIDAAWLPDPFGTIAQEAFGAVPLADFDQGSMQNFPIGAYIGTSQWVKTHPNTVAAFLRALQEGQQVADTDRAAVEQGVVQNTKMLGKAATTQLQAATMTINSYPLTMDVPVMQRVSDAMFEFGLEGGYKQPYQIINMIQPEPGMVTGK
jgi:NitT/TauT family transport system substrate-binding protein